MSTIPFPAPQISQAAELGILKQGVFYLGLSCAYLTFSGVFFFTIFTPKILIAERFNLKSCTPHVLEYFSGITSRSYAKFRFFYACFLCGFCAAAEVIYLIAKHQIVPQSIKIAILALTSASNVLPLVFQRYDRFAHQGFSFAQSYLTLFFNLLGLSFYASMASKVADLTFYSKLHFAYTAVLVELFLALYTVLDFVRLRVERNVLPSVVDVPFEADFYDRREALADHLARFRLKQTRVRFDNQDAIL
ncbi:Transmembrane domain-containing protein [Spironucleus salmonicida]|uniref:Transmembrane domain-containing protein n=1 Tax=Spironucleus salmonicida TaxID=348837 RepID=V6LQD3_9EUKA|nr:Transmembrane domain-containing protein [Spironucleus salmonicida]|eukprot:EST46458.1 Transmembrane domain-containing protein [Spironucleus salmonicida]